MSVESKAKTPQTRVLSKRAGREKYYLTSHVEGFAFFRIIYFPSHARMFSLQVGVEKGLSMKFSVPLSETFSLHFMQTPSINLVVHTHQNVGAVELFFEHFKLSLS